MVKTDILVIYSFESSRIWKRMTMYTVLAHPLKSGGLEDVFGKTLWYMSGLMRQLEDCLLFITSFLLF